MLSQSYISLNSYESPNDYTDPSLNSEVKTEETMHEEYFPCSQPKKISKKKKTIISPSSSNAYKKSPEEVAFLEEEFSKDPSWSRKTVQFCRKALNLRTDQVYKWGFDKKQTLAKQNKLGVDPLNNRELGLATRKEIFMN